jgi:hypothetical protein
LAKLRGTLRITKNLYGNWLIMDSYVYTRLEQPNEIRLLDLHPGNINQQLHGTLRPWSLDQNDNFEAISYVWGPDIRDCILETADGRVKITSSLSSALQRFRLQDRCRTLWADALCINQEDNEEKCLQVRLMGRIYSKATRVLAYLGDDADNSELAQPLIERMASEILSDTGPKGVSARQALKAEDLSPVAALMRRPWFRRAWIIQEFINAKDIQMYFGSSEIHWRTFHQAIENTYSFDELSITRNETDRSKRAVTISGTLAFSTLDMGRDKYSTSLLELFDLFQDKEATRARDHLFSLLSLAHDADDIGLDPHYLEPLESIVRRYAAVFVSRDETFTLLATAGSTSQSSRFPSWIPNWTTKRPARYSTGIGSSTATYSAAGTTKLHARYDRDADELIIRGTLFDQVAEIIRFWDVQPDDLRPINELEQASYLEKCDAVVQSLRSYPTGESLFDIQWRTLIANRTENGDELTQEDEDRMRQSYISLREKLKIPFPSSESGGIKMQDISTEADPYEFEFAAFFSLTPYVTFCVTERGYVGLVPNNTAKGDWICVLYGCPVPFVLRKSTLQDKENFQLIQKTYVHGIMAGETLSESLVQEMDIHLN